SSKSDKAVDAEETIKDDALDAKQVNGDEFVDTQDGDAPTQHRSKMVQARCCSETRDS
ncbi:hypothetical protein Tco_0430413, partial [Tanacetum coccineum]